MNKSFIIPQWPAPASVKAIVTTRQGGYSTPPFDSFNLATHVTDDIAHVTANRQLLQSNLPGQPLWLNQLHSNNIVDAAHCAMDSNADGSYSTEPNCVSVVLTADCLPLLLCNQQGTVVAAVHAGWRGLVNGIVEQALTKVMAAGDCSAEQLLVWLGPAIGPGKFEVGEDVRQQFLLKSPDSSKVDACFVALKNNKNKYFANLYELARIRILHQGIENISGGNYCTYTEQQRFFSYRRNGQTGRMASLIWLEK